MNYPGIIYALATLTGAAGMWLMLPRGAGKGRAAGMLLWAVSLGLFGSRLPILADGWSAHGVFLALAGVTVVSAACAVTFRNPVYCAIWFGLTLFGTAGLLLYQGSQFLAVATLVVYAGAILVTLLFVLMLANPTGHASYDQVSWEAPLSATVGLIIVGVLTLTLTTSLSTNATAKDSVTNTDREAKILHDQHVARLGAQLFSRHLIAVEVAGTLLLVALVGAIAMVMHSRTATRRSEVDPAEGEPSP